VGGLSLPTTQLFGPLSVGGDRAPVVAVGTGGDLCGQVAGGSSAGRSERAAFPRRDRVCNGVARPWCGLRLRRGCVLWWRRAAGRYLKMLAKPFRSLARLYSEHPPTVGPGERSIAAYAVKVTPLAGTPQRCSSNFPT
jgi:hypothetical protein